MSEEIGARHGHDSSPASAAVGVSGRPVRGPSACAGSDGEVLDLARVGALAVRRGPASTTSIAVTTMAPPPSSRQVSDSPPRPTANVAANTGSMLITIAARVGARWAWAQVWAISAAAPATTAM